MHVGLRPSGGGCCPMRCAGESACRASAAGGLEPFVAPPAPEEQRRAATAYREWREAQTRAHRAQLAWDVKAAAKSGQDRGGDDGGGYAGDAAGSGRGTVGRDEGGSSGGTSAGRSATCVGGAGGGVDDVSSSTGLCGADGGSSSNGGGRGGGGGGTWDDSGGWGDSDIAIGTTGPLALWSRRRPTSTSPTT